MAIISCNTLPRRTGSWELNNATYSETWTIEAEAGDDPYTILNYVWGFITLFYHGTVLQSLTCDQIDRFNWTVTGTWKNLTPEEKEKSTQPDPLSRPVSVSYSTREYERLAELDRDGEPVNNSATDQFNPAPVTRSGKAVLIAKKNFGSFDPSIADSLVFHLNSGSLFGYAARQLLCVAISAEQQTESVDDAELSYWQVTFEFESDTEDYHKLKLVDAGYRELNEDGDLIKIRDAYGEEVAEPALLNGSGHKLDTTGTVFTIEFDMYPETDFGAFLS